MATDQREASAFHEAGHAVFAWRHHYMLREGGVSIEGDGVGVAPIRTEIFPGAGQPLPPYSFSRLHLERKARAEAEIALAGPQAERRALRLQGHRPPEIDLWQNWTEAAAEAGLWGEPLNDINEAARVLGEVLPEDEITEALWQSLESVARSLRHPRTWEAIEGIAKALLSEQSLSAERAGAIIGTVAPPRELWPYGKAKRRDSGVRQ